MVRIALVAEKPSLSSEVVRSLLRVHPDMDREFLIRVFVGPIADLDAKFEIPLQDMGECAFRFPKGMGWKDFPAIAEPAYKPIGLLDPDPEVPRMPTRIGMDGSTSVPGRDYDVGGHLASADVVYAAMDAESGSVHAFDRAVEGLFPGGTDGMDIRFPWLCDYRRDVLDATVRAARPWREIRTEHLGASLVKRRFTFNYALNAHAVLGRVLAAACLASGCVPPKDGRVVASRNCLQLLYWLRARGTTISQGLLLQAMERWTGTGRYATRDRSGRMGSSASRHAIVVNLLESGLVEERPAGNGRIVLEISELGLAYLDLIHPDCEDPDQGFRLEAWRELPSDEAFPKVDRYIRTFFGKQKRFGEKALRRIG